MWKKKRLSELAQGDIFRREGFYYVFDGDAGARKRAVSATLIVPVTEQPYCNDFDREDLDDHKHWIIDNVEFHAALYYPGEEDDEWEGEPGLFIRKRSSEIQMWVELFEG